MEFYSYFGPVFKAKNFEKSLRMIFFPMLFVLITSFALNARDIVQAITLNEKDASLQKIIKSLERQSGYYFIYNSNQLKQAQLVTINVTQVTLEKALSICFKNQPFTYAVVDNLVILKSKVRLSIAVTNSGFTTLFPIDVKGRVINENGEPISGVTVTVQGTRQATSTNTNGEFVINNADKNAVLIFSGANVETFTLNVSGKAELVVKLKTKVNKLDDVQVIAYGTTTRRLNTGNIGTVKATEIDKQPVNNVLLALEGRVPGLLITQANGIPGGGVSVQIQGQNSIGNSSDPLYVIDGVPYLSQNLSTIRGGSASGPILGKSLTNGQIGSQGNPLSYINPADIESVDILKDADATAIYGTRAANGAILITTKRGKLGQTKVSLDVKQGWGKVGHSLDLLSTQQYIQMRKEAKRNDNAAILASDYDLNGLWDSTRFTDWQKVLIGGTAQYGQYSANISGGTTNMQYLVGATYHRETTVFPGDFASNSGAIHFNINSNSLNQKFRIQFTGSYMINKLNLPGLDFTRNVFLAPVAPALYNPDGTLNWAPNLNANGTSSWSNPLANMYNLYDNKTSSLVSNTVLSYRIIPGMEIKTSFGFTSLLSNEFTAFLINSIAPEARPAYTRSAIFTFNSANSWIIEPQFNYKRNFNIGKMDLLVGAAMQEQNNDGKAISASGQPSDKLLRDLKSATAFSSTASDISTYKYNGFFGRLNYNLQDKYIVNLSVRRDGSSRFGDKNKFHSFGSIGGAWIFAGETQSDRLFSILSFGKLRGSYGTTGSDQTGNYGYLNLYNAVGYGNPYQGTTSLTPRGLTNPYLQWEETRKLQIGIELGFLKDKILVTGTYVRNRSSNHLLQYNLPSITGFSTVASNFPALVQNRQWEFQLNVENIEIFKGLSWSGNVNLTIPNNELLSFPNLSKSSLSNSLIVGQPLSTSKTFRFAGVDPATGIYRVYTRSGEPTSSPNTQTDAIVIYNMLPRFYGGFQNDFKYKNFQLDIFFQFVNKKGFNFYSSNLLPGNFSPGAGNQPTTVLDRWQKPGDISKFQYYSSLFNLYNFYNGDAFLEDLSYLRLKNISVSYQFTESVMQKLHLHNVGVFLNAQNLITITAYKGLDPESLSETSLPPLRVVTMGLQIGF